MNIFGSIISTQFIGISSGVGNNTINIGAMSSVFGASQGIYLQSFTNSNNIISNAGQVIGGTAQGVRVEGSDNSLTNTGVIKSHALEGLAFLNGGNLVNNSGIIEGGSGGDALIFTVNGNTVVNSGALHTNGTFNDGLDFDGITAGVNNVLNTGTITGGSSGYGLDGEDGQEIVTNNGQIQGGFAALDLRGGNDVYDGTWARSSAPFSAAPGMIF